MLAEVTHISILPFTDVIRATGVTHQRHWENPYTPVTGAEYVLVRPVTEPIIPTMYDGD